MKKYRNLLWRHSYQVIEILPLLFLCFAYGTSDDACPTTHRCCVGKTFDRDRVECVPILLTSFAKWVRSFREWPTGFLCSIKSCSEWSELLRWNCFGIVWLPWQWSQLWDRFSKMVTTQNLRSDLSFIMGFYGISMPFQWPWYIYCHLLSSGPVHHPWALQS